MLEFETLNYISDRVDPIYKVLQEDILKKIIRRLTKNDFTIKNSDKWDILKLQEAGMLYDDIINEVAKAAYKSEKEIARTFAEAAVESLEFEDIIFKKGGLTPLPIRQSPHVLAVLNAGIKKTAATLKNLTMTTANTAHSIFISAADRAHMQILSGSFSYNEAIYNAVTEVLKVDKYITYPLKEGRVKAHRDKVDVAVRRSVLTGVNQTMAEVTLARCEELDTDLVEVTAHAGARPEHAVWQGSICSISGKSTKYPKLSKHTGYGDGAGLCGWNCHHSFSAYIEGMPKVYSDSEIEKLKTMTVPYDGKKIGYYDATQIQRKMERSIKEEKRKLIGYELLDGNVLADMDFVKHAKALKETEEEYDKFCLETGLPAEKDRLRVVNFNKSISQKAVWAYKNNK